MYTRFTSLDEPARGCTPCHFGRAWRSIVWRWDIIYFDVRGGSSKNGPSQMIQKGDIFHIPNIISEATLHLVRTFHREMLHCQSRFSLANIPPKLKANSAILSKLVIYGNIPAYVVVHLKVVHLNIIVGGRFSENLSILKFTYVWAITLKKGVVHLTR